MNSLEILRQPFYLSVGACCAIPTFPQLRSTLKGDCLPPFSCFLPCSLSLTHSSAHKGKKLKGEWRREAVNIIIIDIHPYTRLNFFVTFSFPMKILLKFLFTGHQISMSGYIPVYTDRFVLIPFSLKCKTFRTIGHCFPLVSTDRKRFSDEKQTVSDKTWVRWTDRRWSSERKANEHSQIDGGEREKENVLFSKKHHQGLLKDRALKILCQPLLSCQFLGFFPAVFGKLFAKFACRFSLFHEKVTELLMRCSHIEFWNDGTATVKWCILPSFIFTWKFFNDAVVGAT